MMKLITKVTVTLSMILFSPLAGAGTGIETRGDSGNSSTPSVNDEREKIRRSQ